MKPKTLLSVFCLLLVLISCREKEAVQAPPPPEVTVIRTKAQRVPIHMEFVGQTFGKSDIAIRARVEGFLEGIHFEEGSAVKEGDLLYTLESQPFEEKVATRMSKVAEAKTMLAKAKGDLDRYKPLAAQKAVSQSDLDTAVAIYEASIAGLDAAKANLRAAKIQLGYTKIYSPINGIIGKTKAKVGDFVGREPNPVILNVVSQIDTILVQFFITESQYLDAMRRLRGEMRSKKEDREPNFELILIDNTVYEHKGKPDFLDREVDPTTGAILVQASFANPENLLRPGQFAKVKIETDVVENGILIPQRCVTELQGTFSVFVVGNDNKVERRNIKTGPKVGEYWLVAEGIKPEELVVYEGLQKVKAGGIVKPTVTDPGSSKDTESTKKEESTKEPESKDQERK
jgi:membrane fusion protein (multidrug efflux system)